MQTRPVDAAPRIARSARLIEHVARWIEPDENPDAVVYGTIAVGLIIAAEDPAVETYPKLISATAVTLLVYWLAHAYATSVGAQLASPRPVSWKRRAHALRHEWAIVQGAAAPLLVLLIAWAAQASLETAATAAVWTAVVALFLLELGAGARARLPWPQLFGSAIFGAALGGALLLVKALLH
jgi:hypothetical protein